MSGFLAAIQQMFRSVALWVTVQPWEQALRVRAGRFVRRLGPGFYLRIPILDVVHKQTVRRRNTMVQVQTLTTSDGATVTVAASLGYEIADIEKLYRTLHDANDTLCQIAAARIAAMVQSCPRDQLSASELGRDVTDSLRGVFAGFGLAEVELRVTDFAFLRAIRLIHDQRFGTNWEGIQMEPRA